MTYMMAVLVLAGCLGGCVSRERYAAMQAGLDSINAANRNGQPFTVQDVRPYVEFFYDHGEPNERLLAHYLLGLAYYDHGEAPMALQCYQDALDCADTTRADCDYAQLSRVYAQMVEVFYHQGLYRKQMEYQQYASRYAWLGRDTLAALINYEHRYLAYNKLGLIDSAIFVIENVAREYKQYGHPADAAISLGAIIRTLVDKGELKKAKLYMDKYESESGRFNSSGDIERGREIYYKAKGLYYLYNNVLDSAEYYFRKELRDGKDFNNKNAAATGLAQLYQRLHRTDSVAKYAIYAYAMNDSVYAHQATETVERMQAMYDYSRHQEEAHQASQNATRANIRFLISVVVLLIVLLAASWLYIARRKVIESLEQTASELHQIRTENYLLRQDASANQQQIAENEKRIKQLEKKLGKYGKLVFFGKEKIENNLKQSPNYQQIEESAYKGQKLSESDWDTVCNLAAEYYPGCDDFLLSHLQVDSTEYHICLLLRLHFKTGEIANMMGVTPPYISKTCTEILRSLFEKKGSSKDLSKELGKIN